MKPYTACTLNHNTKWKLIIQVISSIFIESLKTDEAIIIYAKYRSVQLNKFSHDTTITLCHYALLHGLCWVVFIYQDYMNHTKPDYEMLEATSNYMIMKPLSDK